MIEHGGGLRKAAAHSTIPLLDWLDLSTGISPYTWPIPDIPRAAWSRLPELEDGFEQAARNYYGVDNLLPIAGSQAAIQLLPQLRSPSRVAMLPLGYAEHARAWEKHQHQVSYLDIEQIEQSLNTIDVAVLINPNNPTGSRVSRERLARWHKTLARKNGWLIVDEAFIDSTPQHSVVRESYQAGLIVLRSLGKFFGLAGVRIGFVMAETELLRQAGEAVGPWTINGPGRYIASRALSDREWQSSQLKTLPAASQKLHNLLEGHQLKPSGGCSLFQWVVLEEADRLYQHLLNHGILIRHFRQPESVRFGLPGTESGWQRLNACLAAFDR